MVEIEGGHITGTYRYWNRRANEKILVNNEVVVVRIASACLHASLVIATSRAKQLL